MCKFKMLVEAFGGEWAIWVGGLGTGCRNGLGLGVAGELEA